jgi:hypothetical protein
MATKKTFNLLKPVTPPKTYWDKIYDWLVDRAKIIILFTQFVIVLAFVTKVIVDTQAKGKEKKIEALESELAFYQTVQEPLFRRIHTQQFDYRALWNGSSAYADVINEVYAYISNPSAEISMKIEGQILTISGTDDIDYLRNLEGKLRSSDSFIAVTFKELSQRQREIEEGKGRYELEAIISEEKIKRTQIQ